MLRDFGGGWPLARPLDHRRNPNQPPLATTAENSSRSVHKRQPALFQRFLGSGSPVGSPVRVRVTLQRDMERPTRFEHHQWVGDKRSQIVHDLDACTESDVISELLEAETYLAFGPDTLAEARNRGYRRCDRCEGMRAAAADE